MSTENKGFDYNGCHSHQREQAARIAGMYSNGPAIFEKAKKEQELKASEAKAKQAKENTDDDDDTEEEDDDDVESTEGQAGTADEGLDEKQKVQKAACQTLGIPYEPTLNKSKK